MVQDNLRDHEHSQSRSLVGNWGALAFLALVIYVPFIRDLFGFAYLHFIDIAICFMAGIASVLWFEGLKMINGSKDLSVK